MKTLSWAPALGLASLLWAGLGQAAPIPEMDATEMYKVNPQAGAWMILAASYSGDDGKELCRQLLIELRNRHRLPAYVFNLAEKERTKQMLEEQEQIKKQNPLVPYRKRTYHIQDQWAVLIGGYKDSKAANAALQGVRNLPMPNLKLPSGKLPYDCTSEPQIDGGRVMVKSTPISPFVHAMCVPNPTIANPHQNGKKYDPFWERLNEGESFSLLRARKPWTLVVKEYIGGSVVQPKTTSGGIMDSFSWLGGHKPGEYLDAAGQQAHKLAESLRDLHFDAYVFHTRTSSVVTIGNFDNPEDKDAQRVRQQYQSFQQQQASSWTKTGKKDPLELYSQPIPIEVPRP